MKVTTLSILLLISGNYLLPDVENGGDDLITTIVLVRHAEKMDQPDDPELSQKGIDRSQKLTEIFANLSLDAVYSTQTIRTQQTVKSLADLNGLTISTYQPLPDRQWADSLVSNYSGGVVLISGHSNTVPVIANLLLHKTHFEQDFDENDYGNLLIITITGGASKLLHLRY